MSEKNVSLRILDSIIDNFKICREIKNINCIYTYIFNLIISICINEFLIEQFERCWKKSSQSYLKNFYCYKKYI